MTIEEFRKFINKKSLSQITIGDEKRIWCNGYDTGAKYGLKYSIASTREMFDPTLRVKREEGEKHIIENAISQIEVEGKKLTEKEKTIWFDGYCSGTVDAWNDSIARNKKMFNSKGEENK